MSEDAAIVYGLASTALPFAQSPDEEVERWLRLLRLYGESAGVLLHLGIGEARLTAAADHPDECASHSSNEALSRVAATASSFATQRGLAGIGTVDLLVAVMREYPEPFERALQSRGSDTAELIDQLADRLQMALQ